MAFGRGDNKVMGICRQAFDCVAAFRIDAGLLIAQPIVHAVAPGLDLHINLGAGKGGSARILDPPGHGQRRFIFTSRLVVSSGNSMVAP